MAPATPEAPPFPEGLIELLLIEPPALDEDLMAIAARRATRGSRAPDALALADAIILEHLPPHLLLHG